MATAQPRQRVYKERSNRLQELQDEELLKRYRLNREGIEFVTNLVRDDISPSTSRNRALPAELKVLLTLRFLATGKFQLCNADDHGVSQPSISRAVNVTINSLASNRICRQFINFPVDINRLRENQRAFHQISHFPGVIGVIDGTHIQIQAPPRNENEYVNRHRYHSINTQLVFDPTDKVIDVVARWPGSTHDARIFSQSGLNQLFERNLVPGGGHLLGDSGYPCRRWILTPFLHPQPGAQINYNRSHKRTRACVERGIGQLKRRFHVLHGEIRLSPDKTCKVITACCVLHNICKDRHIQLPEEPILPPENPQPNNVYADINVNVEGLRYREHFSALHFN